MRSKSMLHLPGAPGVPPATVQFKPLRRVCRVLVALAAISLLGALPAAAAATSVRLDGSWFSTITKPDWEGTRCPSHDGDECGVMHLVGLGLADYVYVYGPLFEPNGHKGCFDIDGTFTITLHADGSRVSGPLAGEFCGPGESAHQLGTPSYGGPQGENDIIEFSAGSGVFEGLHGTATFTRHEAGAEAMETLTGTLLP
jgi:hypothetical protein